MATTFNYGGTTFNVNSSGQVINPATGNYGGIAAQAAYNASIANPTFTPGVLATPPPPSSYTLPGTPVEPGPFGLPVPGVATLTPAIQAWYQNFTGALPIAGNFEYQFYEGTRAQFNQYGSGRMTQGEQADLMMRGTAPARVIGAPWSYGPSVTALQSRAPITPHTPAALSLSSRARSYARRGFSSATRNRRWRV